MAGDGITLQGDWSKLEKNLHRLAKVNFTALHKEIGAELVASTQRRFKTETGPDGKKWPSSIRAKAEGGQTLSDTRRLRNSITSRARPDRVEVGTNVKYARIHQLGGTIRAKRAKYLRFNAGGKWVRVKAVKIPPRPFIGISEQDNEAINEIIKEHLEEILK